MTPDQDRPSDFTAALANQIHDLTRKRRNRSRHYRRRIVELERTVEILREQVNLYQSLAISAAVENWNLKHGMD